MSRQGQIHRVFHRLRAPTQQHRERPGGRLYCYVRLIELVVVLVSVGFMACSFVPAPGGLFANREEFEKILNAAPYRPLTSSTRSTVYEAPGLIRVQHGQSCADALQAASSDGLGFRVQETATVPLAYGDTGTVVLNGWELKYAGSDQHVVGLGSAIYNITSGQNGNQFELHWEAGGVLSDRDGAEAYTWCYWYTIVFWTRSSSAFNATAFDDGMNLIFLQGEGSDPGQTTAVRALPGSFTDVSGPRAVVPRGFAFSWADDDHHLLKVGLAQDIPARGGSALSWVLRTLFKDNDHRRNYHGAALLSVLSSSSVHQWQPDTVVRLGPSGWAPAANTTPLIPFDGPTGNEVCVDPYPPPAAQSSIQFRIDNVPFHYAVPVLAGWELGYGCEDHHVRELGVAITSFRYERDPSAATGTLFYTVASSLQDDSHNNGYAGYHVSVVGLNALSGGPPPVLPPPPPPQEPPPPPTTIVPDVRGATLAQATQALQAANLVVGTRREVVNCDAIGLVVDQQPSAGMTQVLHGTAVELWLGKRPARPLVCQ